MTEGGPVCAIVNPRAGSADEVGWIAERLRRLGADDVRHTRAPGDGGVRARDAVGDGFRRLIVVGGDGTLNEVLNGIAPETDAVELALVPAGTGNDFARALRLGPEPEKALEAIAGWRTRPVDVVRAEAGAGTRYLLNASSGGFSTAVDELIDPRDKQTWGALAYMLSAAKALPELRARRVRLTTADGETQCEECLNIVIANGGYLGGGLCLAPGALVDDGAVDAVLVPNMSVVQLGILVSRLVAGDPGVQEQMLVRRARALSLEAEPELEMNADGEPFASTPVRYEVIPRCLRFVMPPEG